MTYFSDLVIRFFGVHGIVDSHTDPKTGINNFLKDLGVTFRHDPSNNRPRANKEGSTKDTDAKKEGVYF